MDILRQIMAERREAVAEARTVVPVESLAEDACHRTHHGLVAGLREHAGTCIVAEMKKASPSAGLLRPDYQPAAIAEAYRENGAVGLSILTEPKHFLGSGEHVCAVRAAVDLPILRKDFMCDSYQVVEAAAWGADVILLIMAALSPDEGKVLYDEALRWGLDVLAEAHTEEEVRQALSLEQAIVGVNSRNLKTLKTDLAVARDLAAFIPDARLLIAESGIRSRQDIEMLEACGYNGFLIGEALMRDGAPGQKLAELLGNS